MRVPQHQYNGYAFYDTVLWTRFLTVGEIFVQRIGSVLILHREELGSNRFLSVILIYKLNNSSPPHRHLYTGKMIIHICLLTSKREARYYLSQCSNREISEFRNVIIHLEKPNNSAFNKICHFLKCYVYSLLMRLYLDLNRSLFIFI